MNSISKEIDVTVQRKTEKYKIKQVYIQTLQQQE